MNETEQRRAQRLIVENMQGIANGVAELLRKQPAHPVPTPVDGELPPELFNQLWDVSGLVGDTRKESEAWYENVKALIAAHLQAAVQAARIEEHTKLETFLSTPFKRRVEYRMDPSCAFDDGANDVKYYIRKWSKERLENLKKEASK